MWGFWIPVELKFWYDYVPWIPVCTKHCNPFLRSSRRLRIPLYGWSRAWGSARLLMLMFVLPLFRVIVEPLSMAATLIWLIGVSFVELKFCPPSLPWYLPLWRYPLTSVAATRLSQLSGLRYISREVFRDTISLQLTAVLWCLFSQSTTDRIGKVLGGALTHTQVINLHINSHGCVCFRFNFCVWNIDDSTIMWPLSHWGGKEKRQIKSWSMYQTATAVWSEPRWKRIFPWKFVTTQRCMQNMIRSER